MNAYDVMHEWDRETGRPARTDGQLDDEVPALMPGTDYEDWKVQIEERDIAAIKQGMRAWGLPIGHLGQFEAMTPSGTVGEGLHWQRRRIDGLSCGCWRAIPGFFLSSLCLHALVGPDFLKKLAAFRYRLRHLHAGGR